MKIISIDKTIRNNTVQDLKDFNSQSSATPAEKKGTTSFEDANY